MYLMHFNPNHDPKSGRFTYSNGYTSIYQKRAAEAAKTKNQVDAVFNSLSEKDKKMLGTKSTDKEWLSFNEGEYVVKRFIKKVEGKPVAFLDIMATTKKGHYTVAIATDPNYRGKGYSSSLAQKGKEWYDRNKGKLNAESLGWGAYAKNTSSTHIAEKTGFKYNKEKSNKNWSVYDYM